MKVINRVEFNDIYNDVEIGQAYWYIIHTFSLRYPYRPTPKDKHQWKRFFDLLEHLLPCESCRTYYKMFRETYPLENNMNNTLDLFQWTYMLHNFVNDKLGKIFTLDMKTAFNIYYNNGFESDKFVQFLLLLAINFDVFSQRIHVTQKDYLDFIEVCLDIIDIEDSAIIRSKVLPISLDKQRLIQHIISCFKNYLIWIQKYLKVYLSDNYKYKCRQCTIECCIIS